jgi:hypothetical protein
MRSLKQLSDALVELGCERLWVKELAVNDNTKNQVYFGPNFKTLNLFPNTGIYPDSSGKNPIFKAGLSFFWLNSDGQLSEAPNAKLILYPQYPEVRFSGFLLGSKNPPSNLFKARRDGLNVLPQRLLFLGINRSDEIIGFVIELESEIAKEFLAREWEAVGLFYDATSLLSKIETSSKTILLRTLKEIFEKGWIKSKRLQRDRTFTDCNAPNCGGYTLEAELGIIPNGISEPDYLGWEVKQHKVAGFENLERKLVSGAITLMTPEPTAGYYRDKGVRSFVLKYGYPDNSGIVDRYNFGGVHKSGNLHPTTKLTLTLDGFDRKTGKITDADGGITLYDQKGKPAATWQYSNLMNHWNRKHAQAVYVPSISGVLDEQRAYKYGQFVRLGEGTDFLRFLKAIDSGVVYYDPGIKVENISTKPKQKTRSQFRIKSGSIGQLYDSFTTANLED